MKKRNGFTLIELIVGMAIMAIIFGGIVYIFGASTKAMQAGQNQQQAYEDARVTMDILKTSLRYAILDDTTYPINPEQPGKTTTSFTFYTKQFDLHWDINNGETKVYKVVVDFKTGTNPNSTTAWTSGKKQLVITITDADTGKQVSKSPFKYPQYEANSGWTSDGTFPIIYGEGDSNSTAYNTGVKLYNIELPFVYKIAGSDKTETLKSRVQPVAEDHYDKTMSDGTGTMSSTDIAMTLIKAATNMYGSSDSNYGSGSIANGNSGFANIVSSGSMSTKIGYSRAKLDSFLQNNSINGYKGTLADLEDHSWVIVPIKKGNVVQSWELYVAKNVIDDLDDINDKYSDKTQPTIDKKMADLAEEEGKYLIRANSGFLCYKYVSDGMTGKLATKDGKVVQTLGYVTGYRPSQDTSIRAINVDKWIEKVDTSTFLNVQDKNNDYIEDQYKNNNIQKAGKYKRIDYSQFNGEEYTKATAGTSYVYPFYKHTYTS